MRLLLDTHAALWWASDDPSLSQAAVRLVEDPTNVVLLSAVVAWEITIKRSLGKLEAPGDVLERLLVGGATRLPVSLEHAVAVGSLPRHHGDPFDRLLIAQATVEDATVLTRDARFGVYDVATAW